MAEAVNPSSNKSSLGLDENIAGALAYFFAPVSSVLFFLMEKNSKFIKFHAIQATILFVVAFVVYTPFWFLSWFIDFFGLIMCCVGPVVFIAYLVGWLFLMWKAYNNEMYKLPVIGDIAEKQATK